MKPKPSPRELDRFSIVDIINYLGSTGWKESPTKNKNIRRFLGPNSDIGEPLTVSVPVNNRLTDYYDRIQDLVLSLSAIQDLTIDTLVERISLVSSDVLRMSVLSSLADSQSLPLDIAAMEVEGLRELYMWSACSEQRSAPYFDKPTSLSESHVRNCRFGHTFEGSFGFTVTSPIIGNFDQLSLFAEAQERPFERKVTERIARGFSLVSESIEKDAPEILIDNFTTGMNSRMCDALVKMSAERQNELVFLIDWSYRLEPSSDLKPIGRVRFKEREFELLEYAAEELRKIEPFLDTIVGKIVTLHSIVDPRSNDDTPRTAIIKHTYENRSIDVRLELDKDRYLVAYNAHGKGQAVRVRGKLYRKGTIWRMTDIEEIDPF